MVSEKLNDFSPASSALSAFIEKTKLLVILNVFELLDNVKY